MVAEEGQMEQEVLVWMNGRSGGLRQWRGGGLNPEPPLPKTTSRPSHIQINTKPVGSRERRQIRRRRGVTASVEDGFSATLKPI